MGKKHSKPARQPLVRIERPLTLIAQVEQTLRKAIAEGVFPGDRLPTTIRLAEQLGVSRETVRLALDSLQHDGLLVKHRRRGTFVQLPGVPTELARTSRVLGYLQADYGSDQGEAEMIIGSSSQMMLGGALAEAGDAGYQMIVRSARIANLRSAFDDMNAQSHLDGILFASIAEEKLLRRLSGLNMAAVLLDHDLNLPKLSSIRPDSHGRARLAVRHLAELGHRRIALAHWHREDLNPWHLRGYREGMREAGLRCRRNWEIYVRITADGAAHVVNAIQSTSPRPTAVVCFNNALASLVIEHASHQGLHVPGDFSVIGGGGEHVIGLTCVQLDWRQLGRQAMRMLLAAIEAGERHRPEHRVQEYQLQPGSTTAAPSH